MRARLGAAEHMREVVSLLYHLLAALATAGAQSMNELRGPVQNRCGPSPPMR